MEAMRAKMRLDKVERTVYGESLTFAAVAKKGAYPEDGSDENNTYSKFTPTAQLTMQVTNPALFGKFSPGEEYYLSFIKAE